MADDISALEDPRPDKTGSAGAARKVARGTGSLVNFFYKLVLVLAFIVGGVAIGGFFKFTTVIGERPEIASIEPADGIVVLTGGPSRIKVALELLKMKKAKRLLISGVNPRTSEKALQRLTNEEESTFSCCVDIDREAADTIGNARQAAGWVKEQQFKSLIVVTSAYHIPRSMLEMRRAMPGLKLQPVPVPVRDLQKNDWYRDAGKLRFVLSEYGKYLGAQLRPAWNSKTAASMKVTLSGV